MKTNWKKALLVFSLVMLGSIFSVTAMAGVNAPVDFAAQNPIDIPGPNNETPQTSISGQVWGGYTSQTITSIFDTFNTSGGDPTGGQIVVRSAASETAEGSYLYTHLSSIQADAGGLLFIASGKATNYRVMIRHADTQDWFITDSAFLTQTSSGEENVIFSDFSWGQIADAALLTELNTEPMVNGGEQPMVLPTSTTSLPDPINVDAVGLYIDAEPILKNTSKIGFPGIWVYPAEATKAKEIWKLY